jgi:arylsulfatase A-like enzyme
VVGGPCAVLVTLDTVRADTFWEVATAKDAPPAWQQLYLNSSRFTDARTLSDWTLPSMASLMTGVEPSTHRAGFTVPADRARVSPLGDELETLAEAVARHGVLTIGLVSSPYLTSETGFEQGFELFANLVPVSGLFRGAGESAVLSWALAGAEDTLSSNATTLARMAREHLEFAERYRFLLWVHALDAHLPYESGPAVHPEYWRCPEATAGDDCLNAGSDGRPDEAGEEGDPSKYQAYYREGVKESLAGLEPLIGDILARGLLRRCMVVVTADHGEELGEYGRYGHGFGYTPPVLTIPLMVAGPGVEPGDRAHTVYIDQVRPMLEAHFGGRAPLDLPSAPSERAFSASLTDPRRIGVDTRDARWLMEGSGVAWKHDLVGDPEGFRHLDPVERLEELMRLRTSVEDGSPAEYLQVLGYLE